MLPTDDRAPLRTAALDACLAAACPFRGDPVAGDAATVIDAADAVVVTGMTPANGTFDPIEARCRDRGVPLTVYAQTGAAVAPAFLGSGVDAQSAEPTALYRYRP